MKTYLILLTSPLEFYEIDSTDVTSACERIKVNESSPRIYDILEKVDDGVWTEMKRIVTVKWIKTVV